MILHTVNKSPLDSSALDSCLRTATEGDIILLIENGVYCAVKNTHTATPLCSISKSCKVVALLADVLARGIKNEILHNVDLIEDGDFVILATQASAVQSWY